MSRRQVLGAPVAAAPAWDARAGALPDPPPDPDDLFGAGEWVARERCPALSFLDPRWPFPEAWKAEARRAGHP